MIRNKMSIDKAINVIQNALGITISDEKKQVLKSNYTRKTLICSAAGSGKTSLIMWSILMKLLTGQLDAKQIIDETFSHKAREDMDNKFNYCVRKLRVAGIDLNMNGRPKFTTFHALYLHLLKAIQPVHVLNGLKPCYRILEDAIVREPTFFSESDLISKIFLLRSQLINRRYTWDGITYRGKPMTYHILVKLANDVLQNHYNNSFFKDYLSVVKAYQQYKKDNHKIDFTDMEVDLYSDLQNPKKQHIVTRVMRKYKFCFIDEFQDINNLQWELTKRLLCKEAWDHLVTVGDDDQAIYAFRGSNPDIILNFKKNYPETQIYHLSINYRTGGNILKCVIPLIECNKYRLPKSIKSSHKGTGGFTVFESKNPEENDSSLLFSQLSKQIKDPDIDNRKIAILCRYNVNKMFAADYLANLGVYVNVNGKSNILQNDRFYKVFMGLIEGLRDNRFALIRANDVKIGFQVYDDHIADVLKANNLTTVKTITKYLDLADAYDSSHQGDMQAKYGYKTRYLITDDENLEQAVDMFGSLDNNANGLGRAGFQAVQLLTQHYYKYMGDKKYMNNGIYHLVLDYFQNSISRTDDMDKFIKFEQDKKNGLESRKGKKDINVLSLHQSKGLQFDYVYLYNLTDDDVKDYMVEENKTFSPAITKLQFLKRLIGLALDEKVSYSLTMDMSDYKSIRTPNTKTLDEVVNNLDTWMNDLVAKYRTNKDLPVMSKSYRTGRLIVAKAIEQFWSEHLHDTPRPFYNVNDEIYEIYKEADGLYQAIQKDSKTVEEERRLIYVGVTRAKKHVYLNIGDRMNPLLNELWWPGIKIVNYD